MLARSSCLGASPTDLGLRCPPMTVVVPAVPFTCGPSAAQRGRWTAPT